MRNTISLVVSLIILQASPSYATPQDEIDALFSEFTSETPGCNIAADLAGEPFYRGSFGSANLEHSIPIDQRTRIYAGSVSKQFTVAAVLLLAQDGKLSIDDSVRKYFPELPSYTDAITIRHLIHHTSGLRDHLTLKVIRGEDHLNASSVESVIELIARQEATNFPVGSEHLYSNAGYFLMAELVKRVSGESLAEFSQTRLFTPQNMAESHFHDDHLMLIPKRAEDYLKQEEGWQTTRPRTALVGAGGIYTTPEDLLRWNALLLDEDDPLSQALRQPGRLDNGEEIPYGFGLAHGEHSDLQYIGHNGALAGYRAYSAIYPKEDFSIAILCNLDQVSPFSLGIQIAEIALLDRSATTEVDLHSDALDRLIGEYEFSPSFKINITREGDQLYAQATNQAKLPIYAETENKYFWKAVDAQVTFDLEGDEPASGLTLHQNGANPKAFRAGAEDYAKLDVATLDKYVGDYQFTTTFKMTITREENQLYAQATGQEKFAIFPESETKFFWKVIPAKATFNLEDGEVKGLTLHQNAANLEALRVADEPPNLRPLEQYAGTYYSKELDATFTISVEGGELLSQLRHQEKRPLVAMDRDKFSVGQAVITMTVDDDGKVQGFVLDLIRAKGMKYTRM